MSVTTAAIGNSNSTSCLMSFTVGAAAAADGNAVILGGQDVQRASATAVLSGLTPGSTTFTAQYRAQGSGSLSCTFSNRATSLIPLP